MPATPQQQLPVPPSSELPTTTGVDEQSADWRGLKVFLRQTKAFRLALALYDDPVARDVAICSLRDELAGQGVRVLTLDLRESSSECTLLGSVEAIIKSATVTSGERLAVMLVNLEGQVDYTPELAQSSGPGTAYLETANLHRELFPGVCPGPMIVWMTELLERAFVKYAPDLWHWRSHVFDLRTRMNKGVGEIPTLASWASWDFRRHPASRLKQLEEELSAYRKTGSTADEGRTLNLLGLARLDGGEFRAAINDFEKARDIAIRLSNKQMLCNALGNLGNAYTVWGKSHKAVEFHEQALKFADELNDEWSLGKIWGNLGLVYHDLRLMQKAIQAYDKSREISFNLGDQHALGNALGNMGNIYRELGQMPEAIEYLEKALEISRQIDDKRGEGASLGNLGNVYNALGEYYKAIKLYVQSLSLAQDIGNRSGEAIALWNLALNLYETGERDEAVRHAQNALIVSESIGFHLADDIRDHLTKWQI